MDAVPLLTDWGTLTDITQVIHVQFIIGLILKSSKSSLESSVISSFNLFFCFTYNADSLSISLQFFSILLHSHPYSVVCHKPLSAWRASRSLEARLSAPKSLDGLTCRWIISDYTTQGFTIVRLYLTSYYIVCTQTFEEISFQSPVSEPRSLHCCLNSLSACHS